MNNNQKKTENPLYDIISKDVYYILDKKGLINEKAVRDHQIRRKFKQLREKKVKATSAIQLLREEYPYLQYDSIRKIVYKRT